MLEAKINILSDAELYRRCKEYGLQARTALRKFAGLLCEVNTRRLYKRKGFASIHEFAAKLAGMSHETTDKILRLAEKLKDKSLLYGLFERGEVGWSKLEIVAYIGTPETDSLWAHKVLTLSTQALVVYVQEIRKQKFEDGNFNRLDFTDIGKSENKLPVLLHGSGAAQEENFTQIPSNYGQQAILGHNDIQGEILNAEIQWERLSILLHPRIAFKLRLFKQRIEKEKRKTLSWNEVFEVLLTQQKLPARQFVSKPNRKVEIKICPDCEKKRADVHEQYGIVGRKIPSAAKKIIDARTAGRCEFPGCNQPAKIYHHTRRFILRQNHDHSFIRSLCVAHERLAHAGLIPNEEEAPALWQIAHESDHTNKKFRIDQLVNQRRTEKRFPP